MSSQLNNNMSSCAHYSTQQSGATTANHCKQVEGTLYLKSGLEALIDCKKSGELQTISNKRDVSLRLNCHKSMDVMILVIGSEHNVAQAIQDMIDLIKRVSPQYFSKMQTITFNGKS